jgi:hypothetical protein
MDKSKETIKEKFSRYEFMDDAIQWFSLDFQKLCDLFSSYTLRDYIFEPFKDVFAIPKLLLVLFFMPLLAAAQSESYFQDKFCKGVKEYVLSDRTRVDCLTDTHAIEYDFSNKYSEAIGQSLGYTLETGNKAGIVLILKKDRHYKHWIKLNTII